MALLPKQSPFHRSPPEHINCLNIQDEMKTGVGTILCLTTTAEDWVAINANAKHNYKQCLGFRRYLRTTFQKPRAFTQKVQTLSQLTVQALAPCSQGQLRSSLFFSKLVLQTGSHTGTVPSALSWTTSGICARWHKPTQCHGLCWQVTSMNDQVAGDVPGTVW